MADGGRNGTDPQWQSGWYRSGWNDWHDWWTDNSDRHSHDAENDEAQQQWENSRSGGWNSRSGGWYSEASATNESHPETEAENEAQRQQQDSRSGGWPEAEPNIVQSSAQPSAPFSVHDIWYSRSVDVVAEAPPLSISAPCAGTVGESDNSG